MSDLSQEDIKGLGRTVGIDIDEALLAEVTYNLNALRDLLEEVNPDGLSLIEPVPIIDARSRN